MLHGSGQSHPQRKLAWLLWDEVPSETEKYRVAKTYIDEQRLPHMGDQSVASLNHIVISLQEDEIENIMQMLFTRMCGIARSGVQPDPNLLIASWRDKNLKSLSFFQVFSPIRTLAPYRFFKGSEQRRCGGQDERTF